MQTLFLRLEGPLQAWGLRARWGERDTALAPTKSGVIGLLGCALGLRRTDDGLRVLSDKLQMGVRIDRPGALLHDYHTTGGAKATDGKPEGILSADGKHKRETDVSNRFYLADASFLVTLQGSESIIASAAAALQSPVWPIFLGRKSCPPAVPVFAGTGDYENMYAALISQPVPERVHTEARRTHQPVNLRLLLEVRPREGNRQNDNIGNPARRVFLPRFVVERSWSPDTERPTINTFE